MFELSDTEDKYQYWLHVMLSSVFKVNAIISMASKPFDTNFITCIWKLFVYILKKKGGGGEFGNY